MATIRASEISEYTFCARAWWLRRVEGMEPDYNERLQLGQTLHEKHGATVAMSNMLVVVASLLLIIAAFVAILM